MKKGVYFYRFLRKLGNFINILNIFIFSWLECVDSPIPAQNSPNQASIEARFGLFWAGIGLFSRSAMIVYNIYLLAQQPKSAKQARKPVKYDKPKEYSRYHVQMPRTRGIRKNT